MKLFRITNIIITCLLCLFILTAVCTVLVRGVPELYRALKTPEIIFALKLSLFTSTISTFLCLIVALPVAYTLSRYNIPGQGMLGAVLRIPLNLPPIVSGVCLLLLFGTTHFGKTMEKIGLDLVFTVQGIVVAQFFVNSPGLVTVLKGALESVDARLEYVARTLGCSPWQAFCRVTIPLIRNSVIAGLVLAWGKALGEFGAVLMLAGAIRFKTETLPISIFLNMSTGDLDLLMASASILVLVSILSLLFFEKAGNKLFWRVYGP
ncbi:MAG: Molybdate/tungstate transport system permease protein WtpB [Desulfotomaculum sp. 46_296]|nr:MAG: Molybdate/tungstate transport system permease protein WtpB [Desulfotomaculum sp. 46_296]HAU32494.1 molybdate ABC transporter permease subunit [Desulfotomaculum sp.]